MKHMQLIATFAALAAIAVGCKPSEEKSTSGQFESRTQETKEASQDMKEWSYAQKAKFVENMESRLDALDRELDQFSAKIESSNDTVKAEAKPELQALRDQAARLTTQLHAVKDATESTWDNVKATSQKSLDSLEDGFEQSRLWLSDYIAP